MDDFISRQAAIDAILHNQEVYSNNFGDDPIDKYTIAIIDNDAQTIAQLPSAQPEWIPCSEKLPYAEYGESPNVYCYCYDPDLGGKWTQLLYYDGGVWCLPTGETFEYKVLAWYPLPTKPYKGDKDETD